MIKNIFGKLTGWQITAIVCTGLVVPTTLYAVTYSNVALINPSTGVAALIDAGGAQHELDIMAQYSANPVNKVTIEFPMYTADGCSSAYTIPAGKALVITSMSGDYYNADGGAYSGVQIYSGATCNGIPYIKHFVATPTTTGAVVDLAYDYGNGVVMPAGSISAYSTSNTGYTHIHGYLIPSTLVSAASFVYASDVAGSMVQGGAAGAHGPSAK